MTPSFTHRFRSNSFNLAVLFAVSFSVMLAPTPRSTAQNPHKDRLLVQSDSINTNPARRVALVIGNGAYTNAPTLKNPPNDARDMAATLKELGFEVTSDTNVSHRDMKRLIREFGQKLRTGGAGLFYYAGHGVQSKGRNYLIPVEADIQSEAEIEDASVDVNLVLNYMDDAQNGLNIVILDACRNNPFARSFRSASNGLAQVDAPTGTLIGYATAPGRVASDGPGQNGLYTAELLKQMRVSGLSVSEMFMRVRAEVMKQTSSKQVPWEASSLVGSFYFSAGAISSGSSKKSNTIEPPKIDSVAVEREYWETIRGSNDVQDFKNYLRAYPSGAYTAIARAKIRQLEVPTNTRPTSLIIPMARFRFNGEARNEGNGIATVENAEFRNTESGVKALYLNGVYGEYKENTICKTPELKYSTWTAVIRFKAENFGSVRTGALTVAKSSILVGGHSYRWFALSRSESGNLRISLNNQSFNRDLGASLYLNRWTVIACGFDLVARKLVVYLNGAKIAQVELPRDFKLEVVGSDSEELDKEWVFANYSNAAVLHGLVSDLVIYDRLLSPEEFNAIPLKP
jgi:hypothetical protein